MKLSRRAQGVMLMLGLIAGGNGLLLGLSLYALLTLVLHVLGIHAPGIGWAVFAGGIGAFGLLARSCQRVKIRSDMQYGESLMDHEIRDHARLIDRLAQLTRRTSLKRAPALRVVDGALPNAYAVGHAREEAAVVVTRALLRDLGPAEQDAVVAHQLAQIENDEAITAAFADAIAVSIEELGRVKGRLFWSPRAIFVDILPFLGAMIMLAVLDKAFSTSGDGALVLLLFLVLWIAVLGVLFRAVLMSWRGLAQFVLFALLSGPTTLIELFLEPPTAFLLSRLVSRERVLAADRRATELTREPGSAIAALRSLEKVEQAQGEPSWPELRFSLFVVPRAQRGLRSWHERFFSSHPPVRARIERLAR